MSVLTHKSVTVSRFSSDTELANQKNEQIVHKSINTSNFFVMKSRKKTSVQKLMSALQFFVLFLLFSSAAWSIYPKFSIII